QVDRYKTHNIEVVVDRFVISENSRNRISQSVYTALEMADGTVIIHVPEDKSESPQGRDVLFSQKLFDAESGIAYDDPAPHLFSFNSPYGACKTCSGLGYTYDVDPELLMPNHRQSLNEGGIRFLGKPRGIFVFKQLEAVLATFGANFDTPINEFPEELVQII